MSPLTERRILALSRVTGWALAAMLLASSVVLVARLNGQAHSREAAGQVLARSFIDKVIYCRRHTPRPHPSWAECERRVRDAE